ncbi:MAG TPA: tetratricopeptide repeat protein, partial [Chthoniobacterales bacterium]
RWNRHLHDLGECEVKHGRKLAVYNFYTDALGNPDLPSRLQCRRPKGLGRFKPRRWQLAAAAILCLAVLALAAFLLFLSKPGWRAIAVLPFVDHSPARDEEYFSDGVTEQIINSLGKIRGLFVVARSSSFAFKNKPQDIRQIGSILQVTHVLEGSVSRGGGRVRVDANLIDVKNGYQVWGDSYDSTERDALSLQSDVARKVATALRVQLQLSETAQVAKLPTSDPEANDLYLRGRYLLNKRTPDSIQKGRALFAEAVAKDPGFALGRVGIADAYILLAKVGAMSGQEASALAWPEVSSAIATDDQLADAYTSRAVLLTDFEWDWSAAEPDFRRALSLNPNSAAAHHWYARHLAQIGRSEEALDEINAAQRQDPLVPMIRVSKAKILFVAGRYDEALDACLKALELESDFASAYSLLGQAYGQSGQHAKAIEAAQRYVDLSTGTGWARLELAYAYAVAANRAESDRLVAEVTQSGAQFSPYDMATICSAWRDVPGAIQWLERAIDQRSVDVIWIRVDPRLANVRSDAGFDRLIEKMKLGRGNP